MKKLFISLFVLTLVTSCSDDTEMQYNASGNKPLEITIIQKNFQAGDSDAITRANNALEGMSFGVGDQIGIYATNSNGMVVVANIPFTLTATGWTTTGNITYAPDFTYYAYYPYKSTLSGAPTVGTTISTPTADAFFSDAITAWTPAADQSTKAAFNGSDLMVAKGHHRTNKTISFTMSHKMALAVITVKEKYHVDTDATIYWYEPPTFTTNIPYVNRNYFLYIVKPNVNTAVYDNTLNVTTGVAKNYNLGTYDTAVKDYLRFHALEDGTFKFSKSGLSYSLDHGTTWTPIAAYTNTPTVKAGKTIFWKNNTTLTPTYEEGIGTFSSTNNFDAAGNIMSLYYDDSFEGETDLTGKSYAFIRLFYSSRKMRNASNLHLPATILSNYCYKNMFQECLLLEKAPELPATTLALMCYSYMFAECTSLTIGPELPATTLADLCYSYMFQKCTSLTDAPELPATTLSSGCYINMFDGCSSLTTAPELPATTLSSQCYQYMFQECTSLSVAPELPATILKSYCYQGMFYGCTSLTTAPELPATTLSIYSYNSMFKNCTNLTSVKAAFTSTPGSNFTLEWLSGVSSTGTFYKNSAASWDLTGVSGIPSGWTIQTYTP